MAKKTTIDTQIPGAGNAGGQGPLVDPSEAQKIAAARKAERDKEKQEKAKRLKKASDQLLSMAKDFEAEAVGVIVPFKDRAGQICPAVVLKIEEKNKPSGRGTYMSARVLVLSGHAQQPYPADLELDAETPTK